MGHTILYVDDEQGIPDVFVDYLNKNGYKVFFFRDPKEAILKYETIKPDLVLLDVAMPVLSGFEIAKTIRSIDANIPILFLSGTPGYENAIKGLKIGANDYIRKDIALEELCARIKKELNRNMTKAGTILRLTPETHIDRFSKKLVSCGETYKFSEKEFQILVLLADNANSLIPRAQILETVLSKRIRSDEYFYKTITKIRSAIKNDKSLILEAVHGSIFLKIDK